MLPIAARSSPDLSSHRQHRCHAEDCESGRVQVAGLVIRDLPLVASNSRSSGRSMPT